MDPAIRPWLELWDYLDGRFWNVWRWCRQNLTPDEVAWQPIPRVASVGWNLQHLAEMLDHYLSHVFGAFSAEKADRPTMISGSLDDGRFRDLDAIAAYHRIVRPRFRTWLAERSLVDFGSVLSRTAKRETTVAWAVGHILEHESYHLGKCTLLFSLLEKR